MPNVDAVQRLEESKLEARDPQHTNDGHASHEDAASRYAAILFASASACVRPTMV
jgi:hypothetical protein